MQVAKKGSWARGRVGTWARGSKPTSPRTHAPTYPLRPPNPQRRHLLMQVRALNIEQSGGLDVIPVRPAQDVLDVLALALLLEFAERKDLRRGLRTDQSLRRE